MPDKSVKIYLAEPRGFCSGVKRAIDLVNTALTDHGTPLYVRHQIVHNKHVINELKAKGTVFVDEIKEIPDNKTVVFSAHGVGIEVVKDACNKHLNIIDATCPLVKKIHQQIKKLTEQGAEIIIIGKKDHEEIIGTIGQIPDYKKTHIINTLKEAENLKIKDDVTIGFVTQTTLSVDDTKEIIAYLKHRFKNLISLKNHDICYATTERQKAIKELAKYTKNIIIFGSKNSSNSKALRDVALRQGAENVYLIDDKSELPESVYLLGSFGISSGASAPEYLVEDLMVELKNRCNNIEIITIKSGNTHVTC